MSKVEHRRFTAEQKLEILRDAEQPGVTVSTVCRRHALAPAVFYRWRAVADNGSAVALKGDAKRRPRKDELKASFRLPCPERRLHPDMSGSAPGS